MALPYCVLDLPHFHIIILEIINIFYKNCKDVGMA